MQTTELQEVREKSKIQQDFEPTITFEGITDNIKRIEFDFNMLFGNLPTIRTTYKSSLKIISKSGEVMTIPQATISFASSIGCDETLEGKQKVERVITDGLLQFLNFTSVRKMDMEA